MAFTLKKGVIPLESLTAFVVFLKMMRLHWDVSTLRLRPLSVYVGGGWPGLVRCVMCGNATIFLIVELTDPCRDQLMTWPLSHLGPAESSGPNTNKSGSKTII